MAGWFSLLLMGESQRPAQAPPSPAQARRSGPPYPPEMAFAWDATVEPPTRKYCFFRRDGTILGDVTLTVRGWRPVESEN